VAASPCRWYSVPRQKPPATDSSSPADARYVEPEPRAWMSVVNEPDNEASAVAALFAWSASGCGSPAYL
jgi:hypothetical protein